MSKITKKKKTSGEKNSLELSVVVSDRVKIVDVRLIKCNCHQTPLSEQGKQLFDLTWSTEAKLQKESGHILLFPSFKLLAKPEEHKNDEPSIDIEALFLLIYKIENLKDIKSENIEAFGNVNGIYNAWPYWREFVQNTISRMGLPKLTIPVFRLNPAQKSPRKKTLEKAPKKTKSKRIK